MNTILQKRIEEAAKGYAWSHDTIGVDKETFHTESSQKHPIPINKHVRVPIYHEMEVAFTCAAYFILKNQWISVEEALPEVDGHGYSKPVLVMSDTNELLVATYSKIYDKWNAVGHVSYHRLVVTHWMPIPSLEGGEK